MYFFVEELEKNSFLKDKFEMRTFQKGEVILKSGWFKIYSLSQNGTKDLIKIYETGELLGDIEVFTYSSVICYLEGMDTEKVYIIKGQHFLQWME